MESSISGIVPNDTPLISEAFTERSLIAEHGMYILVKVKRLGKWFKLKALLCMVQYLETLGYRMK